MPARPCKGYGMLPGKCEGCKAWRITRCTKCNLCVAYCHKG